MLMTDEEKKLEKQLLKERDVISDELWDFEIFGATPTNENEKIWKELTRNMILKRFKNNTKKISNLIYKIKARSGIVNPDAITDEDIKRVKQIPFNKIDEFNKAGFRKSITNQTEKTPSLKWWPKTNTFKDFSSGEGGDIIKYIMLRDNLDFISAVKSLKKLLTSY